MKKKTTRRKGGWSIDKTYNQTHRIQTRKTYVNKPNKKRVLPRFLNKTKYNK